MLQCWGMQGDAQHMGRRALGTPQPLAAADVADVNLLNRLMLRLAMASAQAEIAFPRTAALKSSRTPLVFFWSVTGYILFESQKSSINLKILKTSNLCFD